MLMAALAGAVLSVASIDELKWVEIGEVDALPDWFDDAAREQDLELERIEFPQCLTISLPLRDVFIDMAAMAAALQPLPAEAPDWYRGFERWPHGRRAGPQCPPLPRMRRRQGHDIAHARRQKRRRFVQALARSAT
jgi:hypothetical protein